MINRLVWHELFVFYSDQHIFKLNIFHIYCANADHNIFYYRIVSEFNDYFGPSLFLYFVWGLVTVCGTLIMIEMQIVEYPAKIVLILIFLSAIFD